MRPLPDVQTLPDAVRRVIESNLSDGYPPNRFIGMTQDGTAPDLLAVCTRLINKDENLADIENALKSVPTLLLRGLSGCPESIRTLSVTSRGRCGG